MAQPVVLSSPLRPASRRADGHAIDPFALNGVYDESWRPARSVAYAFAACGVFWLTAALAYVTFH